MANIDTEIAHLKNPDIDNSYVEKIVNFSLSIEEWEKQQISLAEIRDQLPRLVWKSAGICREQEILEQAIAQIQTWTTQFNNLPLSQFLLNLQPRQTVKLAGDNYEEQIEKQIEKQIKLWAETRNLLDIGYLIIKSAAFRTESRGGHYRSDYPETDNNWQIHTLVKNDYWWKE